MRILGFFQRQHLSLFRCLSSRMGQKTALAQYINLFVVLCMPENRSEALKRLYEVAEDQ